MVCGLLALLDVDVAAAEQILLRELGLRIHRHQRQGIVINAERELHDPAGIGRAGKLDLRHLADQDAVQPDRRRALGHGDGIVQIGVDVAWFCGTTG